ncbi:MAG: HD domain-containing phosphohydrolase, partial [Cyanobacteria bacterium P01_H01_bin.15]
PTRSLDVLDLDTEPRKILVVDDNAYSRLTTVDALTSSGCYQVLEAGSGQAAVGMAEEFQPEVILLDIFMPDIDGFTLCRQFKKSATTRHIPVMFTTVSKDRVDHERCLSVGGDDFLLKPLERLTLLSRVRSLIEQKRLQEDLRQTEQVLFEIAATVENRFPDQGDSSIRLIALSQSFGNFLGLSSEDILKLKYSARLHDIGTIGIPDAVLLKQGKLTAAEKQLVQQHVLFGEKLCQPLRHRCDITPIVRHHHERWDGSGYPDQLVGEQIPFLAQIFQILDIFTALTHERPHKASLTSSEALAILHEESEKGWRNPSLCQQFDDFIRSTQNLGIPSK